ncbi:Reverse transcriptase zinc-binding domain [Senna tora]|uniref:Reverse transcriptase zinc-binding domain n=1 Tax=Senna tora TaxID=362788 RepID=A0A834T2I9_9FABA|nr:Reverse transcriptase zinc-binding domain [Senna tora]
MIMDWFFHSTCSILGLCRVSSYRPFLAADCVRACHRVSIPVTEGTLGDDRGSASQRGRIREIDNDNTEVIDNLAVNIGVEAEKDKETSKEVGDRLIDGVIDEDGKGEHTEKNIESSITVLSEIQNLPRSADKENINPIIGEMNVTKWLRVARSKGGKAVNDSLNISMGKRKNLSEEEGEMGGNNSQSHKKSRTVVMEGKKLLVKNLMLCVGDGRRIDIWNDPWVPGLFPYRAIPSDNNVNYRRYVNELMTDRSEWREEMLCEVFSEETCRNIRSIHLSHEQQRDEWTWIGDPKGIFSVKACYKDAMKERWEGMNLISESQCYVDDRFWKKLWKLPWSVQLLLGYGNPLDLIFTAGYIIIPFWNGWQF